MNFEQLRQYEIEDELEFVEIEHGFTYIEINNARAHATISTYSGQVLSYRPKGQAHDLLFVSDKAYYEEGKAIKGGIPVCWPWFGPDPEDGGRPAHGFVRNRQWQVAASESLADGSTKVVMSLTDSDETRGIWRHPFRLNIEITVGDSLRVELVTHNSGDKPVTVSQALHTYFQVGDVERVQVLGLEDGEYLDKVDGFRRKTQSGPVAISGEVDRVYVNSRSACVISDPVLQRRILIDKRGSDATVVWNPWIEKAAKMGDLGDAGYRHMLCVESGNAADNLVAIAPGEQHRLWVSYRVER